jgi:PAS domain S-box-containing protein
VIEYVNPAFEALTGYSPGESMGQTPRVLKSGQQTAELYKDLW